MHEYPAPTLYQRNSQVPKNHFCCNAEKPSFEQLTQKDFEYQMSAVSHQVLIDEGGAGDRQSVREERNYAQ